MAKVPHGVETLPKISVAWVGCANVRDTDRRTTMTYSERERERERSLKILCKFNVDNIKHMTSCVLIA